VLALEAGKTLQYPHHRTQVNYKRSSDRVSACVIWLS